MTRVVDTGRKSRQVENGSSDSRSVEITGPILTDHTSLIASDRKSPLLGCTDSRSLSPRSPSKSGKKKAQALGEGSESWKNSPLYASSNSSDEDEVPEMLKRLSETHVYPEDKSRLSDTMSSDIIVNSISSGELAVPILS